MEPTLSEEFDIAIIGAGIVGCAMARRYTLDGAKVVVLEKSADVLDGASKGNSAILHTGFDAPNSSLEHQCIVNGYKEYLEIKGSLGLPILKAGAVVVAWNQEQQDRLDPLIQKAHSNGVTDVRKKTQKQILQMEPHLSQNLKEGFAIPGEFLIDPWATAHAYILQAMANGATLARNCEVLSGKFGGKTWLLQTLAGPIQSKMVINCAGLFGDIVDQRLIGKSDFTIKPRKGQFVVFDKPASKLLNAIILPVPTKTTKGIVLFRTIFGNLAVGPTAEEQESRADASTDEQTLNDLRLKAIEMLPSLKNCEVTTVYAGIRSATQFQDYQISQDTTKNYVSVGGIRSTGLSAALGIAQYVASLSTSAPFANKPLKNPRLPSPDRLSAYHPRDWQTPGHGGIVCHCELVTKREIKAVLDGPMSPNTLQGLKRRTRVCMGRCQGFYCTGPLAEITKNRIHPPIGISDD